MGPATQQLSQLLTSRETQSEHQTIIIIMQQIGRVQESLKTTQ